MLKIFIIRKTNNKQLYCYKITCANKSIHWSCNDIIYDNIDDFIDVIKNNKLKTGIFLVLSAYWGVILIGTIVQFN